MKHSHVCITGLLMISLYLGGHYVKAQDEKVKKFMELQGFIATLPPACASRVITCVQKYKASTKLFDEKETCKLVMFENEFGTTYDCLVNLGECSQDDYSRLKDKACGAAPRQHGWSALLGLVTLSWIIRSFWKNC